jgi:DNA-directed RNA polymerase subunit delta
MTSKSDKEKKPTGKIDSAAGKESAKKSTSTPKKEPEDDDDDDDFEDAELEVTPPAKKGAKAATSTKKGKSADDDEEDDGKEEEPDEWEKPAEEDNWDPDFEEFDVPKSKGKKAGPAGKKPAEEEEDFKIDDEFKDMFNDDGFGEEEEDDY